MGESENPPIRGSLEAKALVLLSLTAAAVVILVYHFELLPVLRLPFAYAAPLILAACLVLAVRLARLGSAVAPAWATNLGLCYIVGGAAFDIIATLIHTPDLAQEANPIARALLDSGHSLTFVRLYALISQSLFVLVLCSIWLAFLRHRTYLAASVQEFRSPLLFIKAASGGAQLTWRQWMLPLRLSELPSAYHALWVLTVVLLSAAIDRWYLGLEWFELVPRVRWHVLGLAIAIGLIGYLIWLWFASRGRLAKSG